MTEQEYRHLTELIENQNNMEVELYPIAVDIIEKSTKELSKRYIFARQKSKIGQIYYGLSSVPDIAIMDKSFINCRYSEITKENREYIKGCLEIKALNKTLFNKEEIGKIFNKLKLGELKEEDYNSWKYIVILIGEVLWYKKLLYTNGKEWRLLSIDTKNTNLEDKIIKVVNDRIVAESRKKDFNWWEYFKNLDFDFEISDDYITKDCLNDWNNFIIGINDIKWLEE